MSNVLDLYDQTYFASSGRPESPICCSVSGCTTAPSTSTDCAGFITTSSRGGYPAASNAHRLPFGRHRWVSPSDQPGLEIVATPRPREEFDAWLDEQANTPLDAEHGPGWHLAVLPFTDGGAGVSLVVSHCLIDGVGALRGGGGSGLRLRPRINWPAAGSRPRWQALRRGRPPNRARHPRYRPRRRRRSTIRPA